MEYKLMKELFPEVVFSGIIIQNTRLSDTEVVSFRDNKILLKRHFPINKVGTDF